MDTLAKWSVHLADVRTLFSEWERRRTAGYPVTRRFREIESACLFTLCIEHRTDQRYLIGFPVRGIATEPVTINRLFDGTFGEIEDWDIVLVDDPKSYGTSRVLHHRCQLVRYMMQPSTTERDMVAFLEDTKLRVPRDDDLRLVLHIDQEGPVNPEFLSAYLMNRTPQCPYSQVFMFGRIRGEPRTWRCITVYPVLAPWPDLSEDEARALLLDREQYNKVISTEQRASRE